MPVAIQGHVYAVIQQKVLTQKFTSETIPQWVQADFEDQDGALYVVDVTGTVPQPQVGWVWNSPGFSPPPLSLADRQNNAWELIKQKRVDTQAGGVCIQGSWYQTDSISRVQYLVLKDNARDVISNGGNDSTVLFASGAAIVWKTSTGGYVPMTVGIVCAVVSAIADLDVAAFLVSENHKAAMLQVQDPENYDYSKNWPAVYAGS